MTLVSEPVGGGGMPANSSSLASRSARKTGSSWLWYLELEVDDAGLRKSQRKLNMSRPTAPAEAVR